MAWRAHYVSMFSGIEAATVAWEPLGWEPVAFAEVDEFSSEVLAHRFPYVPNLGDVTKIDWSGYRGSVDLIVGGSPCQSFSIAGNREGLKGESGLMFEYIRAVREIMPRYFVWENVPGALSCEKGAAFGQLLREMDELGYGLAWRVLDAQFFGVAQRRRHVFLVGCIGDPGRAAEILFEPESLSWDSPSSREKRKELAANAQRGVGGSCLPIVSHDSERDCYYIQGNIARGARMGQSGKGWSDTGECYTLNTMDEHAVAYAFSAGQSAKAGSLGFQDEQCPTLRGGASGTNQVPTVTYEKAYTLKIRSGCEGGGKGPLIQDDVSGTLATRQDQTIFQPVCMASGMANAEICYDMTPTHTARQYKDPQIVCMADDNANAAIDEDMCGSLKVGGHTPIVARKYIVRKLMPVECERLQGFPDGWTEIPYRGKPSDECPDAPRYKALGNSMAVPVMRWIGERIQEVVYREEIEG